MPTSFIARAFASGKTIRIVLRVTAVALVISVIRFCVAAWGAIPLPFGLDYGEGIVWQQLRMIMAGRGYAPLGSFPAIVFHYPPLYHVVTGLAARATGSDELATGRMVSFVSTLAAAGLLAVLAGTIATPTGPRSAYRLGAAAAAAIFVTTKPVVLWACVMRVDMLFLALSLAGVWLGILALTRPSAIYGAALLFVAALFTKQTAVAAPLAVFTVLLLVNPRVAIKGIATGLVAAIAILAILIETTHGGFLKHIVLYNINRFAAQRWNVLLGGLGTQLGFAIAAIWALTRHWRRLCLPGDPSLLMARMRDDPTAAAYGILLLYLVLATMMLGLIFKSGSAVNYFLEWISLVSLFAGLAVTELLLERENSGTTAAWTAWLLALQVVLLVLLLHPDVKARIRDRVDLARLQTVIAQAQRPVIGDDMVGILRAGKPVLWEPSIFTELATNGVWDERPFRALIAAHRFAFFVSDGGPGRHPYVERHSPGVSVALASAYPQTRYLAQYELRFPAGPLPPEAATLPLVPAVRPTRTWHGTLAALFSN